MLLLPEGRASEACEPCTQLMLCKSVCHCFLSLTFFPLLPSEVFKELTYTCMSCFRQDTSAPQQVATS